MNFNPLLVALLISVSANGLLGAAYLGKRDAASRATEQARTDTAAALACSASVDALSDAADASVARAEAARNTAQAAAKVAQGRALALMSKPPAVPGNDCASARVQVDDWLAARGTK